jgi:curved DNA-binding protein CbpA
MDFNEPTNYYDVLDIRPNASPAEVREAYYRAKSAFNKDSAALYSLVAPEEREEILARIEEAYDILSNDDRRRNYDDHQGIIENTGVIESSRSESEKIVSIDRVPPMDAFGEEATDELLVAPTTDFQGSFEGTKEFDRGEFRTSETPASMPPAPRPQPPATPPRMKNENPEAELQREIGTEVEWRGSFLRHVREAQNISVEEMSAQTKLSKTYIIAIEEENYKKLPAPVFVRGFLVQIARILKLPSDKILASYLERFKAAKKVEDK